jgi:hypothetical protein
MSRVFAYLRVSTVEQSTENQHHEIEAAGFSLERRRVVAECVRKRTGRSKAGLRQVAGQVGRWGRFGWCRGWIVLGAAQWTCGERLTASRS